MISTQIGHSKPNFGVLATFIQFDLISSSPIIDAVCTYLNLETQSRLISLLRGLIGIFFGGFPPPMLSNVAWKVDRKREHGIKILLQDLDSRYKREESKSPEMVWMLSQSSKKALIPSILVGQFQIDWRFSWPHPSTGIRPYPNRTWPACSGLKVWKIAHKTFQITVPTEMGK